MILIFCSFAMNLIFKNYLLVFAMILIFNPFLGRNKAYVQVEQESYENSVKVMIKDVTTHSS